MSAPDQDGREADRRRTLFAVRIAVAVGNAVLVSVLWFGAGVFLSAPISWVNRLPLWLLAGVVLLWLPACVVGFALAFHGAGAALGDGLDARGFLVDCGRLLGTVVLWVVAVGASVALLGAVGIPSTFGILFGTGFLGAVLALQHRPHAAFVLVASGFAVVLVGLLGWAYAAIAASGNYPLGSSLPGKAFVAVAVGLLVGGLGAVDVWRRRAPGSADSRGGSV